MRPCFGRILAALLLCTAGATGWAEVRALDATALARELEREAPCCVVDGRSPERRDAQPLPEALPYRPDIRLHPTANIVVVGDTEAQALAIAHELDKAYPGKTILAVEAAPALWASMPSPQPPHAVQGSRTFVIPRNTCEQSEPLLTLPRAKP